MPLPWSRKNGETLPPELENLTPEQLVEAVNKSKEVDQLRTDLTAATGRLSELDTLKNQIAALEQNRNTPPPARVEENRPTSFLEDEDKAFNERIAPFAINTLQSQAQTARYIAKQNLSERDRKIWEKYESEIDEVVKSVALQYQGNPQTWANALSQVAGRHINDLLKMAEDKTEFFSESASSGGQGGPSRSDNPDAELTEEEKKLAVRFGMTEEEYKKNKKAMVVRG